VLQGNSGISKLRVLVSGTLSHSLDFKNFATAIVDRVVNKTRRQSSLLTTLTAIAASVLHTPRARKLIIIIIIIIIIKQRLTRHVSVIWMTKSQAVYAQTPFYSDLLLICCTTCFYSCAAVNTIATDKAALGPYMR